MIRVGLLNTRRYEFREKRTVSEVLPSLITNMDLNLAYLEPKSDENSTKNTPKELVLTVNQRSFIGRGRRLGSSGNYRYVMITLSSIKKCSFEYFWMSLILVVRERVARTKE